MSAFEVTVTPTRSKNRNHRLESREPTEVIMAPFSAKAIVQFEDVPTTKTAKRILRIINPSEDDIEVKVTKSIKSEHNLTISWTEMSVGAQSEVQMELIWSPQLDVACKETLQLTDSRNFRKDVMIILKSKSYQPAKNTRKFPTISSGCGSSSTTHVKTHVKTLRLKSPTCAATKTAKLAASAAQMQRKHAAAAQKTEKPAATSSSSSSLATATAASATAGKQPHWNSSVYRAPQPPPPPLPVLVVTQHTSPLAERNVYLSSNNSPTVTAIVGGEKENVSPLTPCNVLNLIDKLKFTPATETRASKDDLQNLASWPTPVSRSHDVDDVNEDADLKLPRPRRRLTAAELLLTENEERSDEFAADSLDNIKFEEELLMLNDDTKGTAVAITNNKTFEVKLNEAFDLSAEYLDEGRISGVGGGGGGNSAGLTLNKTTTILSTPLVRALGIIQEEESNTSTAPGSAPAELQTTYSKGASGVGGSDDSSSQLNFKRDIKLVGTPLRKYSKSMKELSLQPAAEMAIQGSLPNLNEMESIRSIEQNRYFYGSCGLRNEGMAAIHEHNNKNGTSMPPSRSLGGSDNATNECDEGDTASSSSRYSLVSQAELMFNQSEILAQSSRFNLNEVGIATKTSLSSPKNSPIRGSKPRQTISENKPTRYTRPPASTSSKGAIKKSSPTTPVKQLKTAAGGQKRRSSDISICEAPSTESIASTSSTGKAVDKSSGLIYVSPPKRQRIDASTAGAAAADLSFQRPLPANASARTHLQSNNWSPYQAKKFKMARTLSLVKKTLTPRKGAKLYDSDLYLQSYINPDPFAATTTSDPFLASTMYLDECAVDKHQTDFRKWLNALVSIPADLDADCNAKIDVGKLFNEVRHKNLTLAPTKEEQSMHYLTKFRLESLRRAAVELFLSEEMRAPCSKVAVYVQKNAIRIRNDRNLHLDVVMQRYILELLLCFNPLWLRLGLEVVYGEKIHMQSNADIVGLSTFILNRLFRDKFLEQKYSKAYTLSEEYAEHIKKFTLQKMLFLLLFLDTAKSKSIVKHNPCLFAKKSPHKETKEILLRFASEMLANIGDITRELRRLGYALQHKQTMLDEFDYAFNNLAVDLRDGVRLTRVMEIILLRDDLSRQLRVPAISRLQRIFNVNLAMRALGEAEFKLGGAITAADIVDGHREKTLSLLWQVIYKFRSPKFHAAAGVLQAWWRRAWLRVCIARRLRQKELLRRAAAATKIQAAYRGYIARRYAQSYRAERTQAAQVLQCAIRGHLARQQLRRVRHAVVLLQRWWRAQVLGAHLRQQFLALRHSVIFLQRCLRRRLLARRLLQLATQAKLLREQRREAAVVLLQRWWRGCCAMRQTRAQFLQKRASVIVLQRRFRASAAMQKARTLFSELCQAAVVVQRRWRANEIMKQQRAEYQRLRSCVVVLQQRRRATLAMRAVRYAYEQQRCVIINAQRRVRATCDMRRQQSAYVKIRASAIVLQRHYRARVCMLQQQRVYTHTRNSIICIQRKWRATLLARREHLAFIKLQYFSTVLQQKFRARIQMRQEHAYFVQLKTTVVCMQRRWRAKLQMRHECASFKRQQRAVIRLQRWWRARAQMRYMRAKFQGTRAAAICIQQHVRNFIRMRRERTQFLKMRRAALILQCAYRARMRMQRDCAAFERLRTAAICIQRRFRARLEMRLQMRVYAQKRQVIIRVQRRVRATLQMLVVRANFQQQQAAAVTLQRCFRATLTMRGTRTSYLDTRSKIISLQRRLRATLEARRQRATYLKQREAAVKLQCFYRALCSMRAQRQVYQRQRNAALAIQRKWRATVAARQQRLLYQHRIQQITLVQRTWRATLHMRAQRAHFQRQQAAAVILQRRFRANLTMRTMRASYLDARSKIVSLQRRLRATLEARRQRATYIKQRAAATKLQRFYRAWSLMRAQRQVYQRQRNAALAIQRKWRATVAARHQRLLYQRRIQQITFVQRKWRATLQMHAVRLRFQQQQSAAIVLQRRYRARRHMQQLRSQYLLIRSLIVVVQRKYRARRAMLEQRAEFLQLRRAALQVQRRFRARRLMRVERERYQTLQRSTLAFQAQARGFLARQRLQALLTPEMLQFLRRRKAAKLIQRFWRGYRVRKRWQRNARILQIRRNIVALRQTSSMVDSIRHKVQDAVCILRGRFGASEALHVLKRLDRLSRTVPHLLMRHTDFISKFCYGIMAQAIRSEVDKQLIEYCSCIILNLARYNSTTANTFQEGGLVTIAQMLLRWCDKDCEIFNTLCTLIWVFAHSVHKRETIRKFMTTQEAIYMVRETKKLVVRKEKMKQNMRKPAGAPVRQQQFSSRALPSLEPDYGVIRSKPYTFISSVYAFDTILCKLGIDIF